MFFVLSFCSFIFKPCKPDGCAALFRPTVSGLKLHVDQVPGLLGGDFGSVQGAYNLYAVEADEARASAGFVCVVGSHRKYDEMWRDRMQAQGFKVPKKHCNINIIILIEIEIEAE